MLVRPYTRHQMRRYLGSSEYTGARGPGVAPMARAFVNASSMYLTNASFAIPAAPCSFGIWFFPTVSTRQIMWCVAAGTTNYIYMEDDGAAHLNVAVRNTTLRQKPTTATFTLNAWHHGLLVCATTTDRRLYLDGANKVTDTTSPGADPTASRGSIGAYHDTAGASTYWSGSLAEWAIWNVALTDADALALATLTEINGVRGCPPACLIRPGALRTYVPCFGNASPELDQADANHSLTLVNAPTKSTTRPPVVYPPSIQWVTGS